MALRCAIVTKLPYMTEDENSTCNTKHNEPAGPEPAGTAQGCSGHIALEGQDMMLAYLAHLKLKSIMVITEHCDCWCAVCSSRCTSRTSSNTCSISWCNIAGLRHACCGCPGSVLQSLWPAEVWFTPWRKSWPACCPFLHCKGSANPTPAQTRPPQR